MGDLCCPGAMLASMSARVAMAALRDLTTTEMDPACMLGSLSCSGLNSPMFLEIPGLFSSPYYIDIDYP